jgi:hypothetical protein
MANLHNRIAALPGDRTISSGSNQATILTAIREEIENQKLLEISNLSGIRTYVESLTNHFTYTSLAEDTSMQNLLMNVSQNEDWKNYFKNYDTEFAKLNPKYIANTDSDKASIIERTLKEQGLPDVLDHIDIDLVANKAMKNSRIDTAGFAKLTANQIIKKCCEQLNLRTDGIVYQQSERLLNNLNAHDRQVIADAIDSNEDADTLS